MFSDKTSRLKHEGNPFVRAAPTVLFGMFLGLLVAEGAAVALRMETSWERPTREAIAQGIGWCVASVFLVPWYLRYNNWQRGKLAFVLYLVVLVALDDGVSHPISLGIEPWAIRPVLADYSHE